MITLDKFKDNAQKHNACHEYMRKWDKCVTKKDVFHLGCEVQGAMFLTKATSEGWGISSKEICDTFPNMVNGQYVANCVNDKDEGYTSALWCRLSSKDTINGDTTVCVVIDCQCDLMVGENNVCMVFADGESDLHIHCPKSSEVIVESYSCNIVTDNPNNTKIKYL